MVFCHLQLYHHFIFVFTRHHLTQIIFDPVKGMEQIAGTILLKLRNITQVDHVNVWNCLSSLVVSADSVNCFKNRLDNFWKNHDYQADIDGTGNRSEVVF